MVGEPVPSNMIHLFRNPEILPAREKSADSNDKRRKPHDKEHVKSSERIDRVESIFHLRKFVL